MKMTSKFAILFFAFVPAACMDGTFIEPEPDDLVKIADGMIQSPQWLADEVNRIADLSGPTGTGEKLYPWVYYVPYNGRNFIYVHGVVGGCYICGNFYFTLSGEPVNVVGADHRLGLYGELEEARRKSGIGNDYNNLLWRYEYESAKSKSSSTRADRQAHFYTPNGTLVPDTWYRDETYITSAQIAAGRDYFKYAYPNAQEVSGPSTTYNCHGYVWSIAEGGNRIWIGYHQFGQTNIFVEDGSYVPTSSDTSGAKVRYLNADHSAIAETADVFVSKWHQYPLYRHPKHHSPFGSATNIAHYVRAPRPTNGPNKVDWNAYVNYSAYPPNGVTFNGWVISPNTYTTTGSLNNPELAVKFAVPGTYSVTAKYTLSDNTSHNLTKQVSVVVPTPRLQSTGTLLETTEASWISVPPGEAAYWIPAKAGTATIQLNGAPYNASAIFEWEHSGLVSSQGINQYYILLTIPSILMSNMYKVRCRANLNGQYSDWGLIWLYVSSSMPTPPNTSYSKTYEDEGSEDYGTENGDAT